MAHYAWLDENNVVVFVMPGRNENEVVDGISDWEEYYSNVSGHKVLRTSYNTRGGVHYNSTTGEPSEDQTKAFRGNYAGVDFYYDERMDAFIPPKPFESWVLDETSYSWISPIPYPEDDQPYIWNDSSQSWDLVEENE
jgi:hypothetical protein